jgi:hypothetical protein
MPVERTLGALPTTVPDVATCIRCAYSLRGLPPQGLCPECGTPIERSLRGDLLLYSDPEYIRKLLAGSRLIFWSTLAIIVSIALAIFLAFYGDRFPVMQLLPLVLIMATLAFWGGWWLLTWPDAGQLTTNKGQRPRRIVRISLGFIVGLVALIFCATLFGHWADPGAVRLLGLLIYPAMGVAFWSGMLYIRWLAPRIPDGQVNRLARKLMYLFGFIVAALLIGGFFAAVGGDAMCGAAALFLGAALAAIVGLCMYCWLFYSLRVSLMMIAAKQRHAESAAG